MCKIIYAHQSALARSTQALLPRNHNGEGLCRQVGRFSNDPDGIYEFVDGLDELLVAMEVR